MAQTKSDGDKIAKSLVAESMAWFEADPAKHTVNECVQFSRKLISQLMTEDLTQIKAKDKSQMLAYLGKTLDQVARLIQFSAGQPDTRAEITIASLLPLLNDDEIAIFNRAIERLEQGPAIGASEPLQIN